VKKTFHFLTTHLYFRKRIEFLHYHYFYFSSENSSFQARIFIPKNEKHTFSWYYYDGTSHIPSWFLELVEVSEENVKKRDRLRRLF